MLPEHLGQNFIVRFPDKKLGLLEIIAKFNVVDAHLTTALLYLVRAVSGKAHGNYIA